MKKCPIKTFILYSIIAVQKKVNEFIWMYETCFETAFYFSYWSNHYIIRYQINLRKSVKSQGNPEGQHTHYNQFHLAN